MSNTMQGLITIDNIENSIGKTVDSKRRMFNYYPLTLKKINEKYFYTDKNGVMIPFDDKKAICFDSVVKTPQKKPKEMER